MTVIPTVDHYAVDCAWVSVLNLNMRTYHLCSRGDNETEEHLLLS